MALSKKIKLANGVETNYHVISLIDSQADLGITTLYIHSFISKKMYDKAIERDNLLKEQEDLLKEFNELESIEEPTATQKTKITKLQNKINKLADEIDNTKEYSNYIAAEDIVKLPYVEDLSISNIQYLLTKTDKYKLANITD